MLATMKIPTELPNQPAPDKDSGSPTKTARRPVRRGEPCPRCSVGLLDYNGLIDLECPNCGYTEGPGAGCT
jgi:ribosomal protein S27AE